MTRDPDLDRLEEFISELDEETDTFSALMREHLDAARFYLLGAMPHEYEFELRLAKDLLPQLENEGLQTRIFDFLDSRESRIAKQLAHVSGGNSL